MIKGVSAPKFVFNNGVAGVEFTADAGTNVITSAAHGLVNGQRITVSSTTALPAPLAAETYYYVINKTADTFKLSETKNGTEINITGAGTGTHTFSKEITVLLDYWVYGDNKPEANYVIHESEIDGEKEYIARGTHFKFEGEINLWKYGTEAQIKSKYDEIIWFLGRKVSLWQHRDGDQFKKTNGNDALFVMKEVIPYYKRTTDYLDALIITFESCSPVDLSLGVTITPAVGEIGMSEGIGV